MTVVYGCDLSLNHGAIVELRDGILSDQWFWSTKAGQAKKKNGTRLVLPDTEDNSILSVNRLRFIREWLMNRFMLGQPEYVGIEDYALQAEQGAHQLGEVGGVSRLLCLDLNIKLRLHDPHSMKMFATLNGSCPKEEVAGIVAVRWGIDFSAYSMEVKKKDGSKGYETTTSGDLTDAYIAARLVWTEVLLRAGKMILADLKEEKERRVFQRVTKTYPISLLDREWITQLG